jgi:hypothetical protein
LNRELLAGSWAAMADSNVPTVRSPLNTGVITVTRGDADLGCSESIN